MNSKIRTDLAVEAQQLWQEETGSAAALPGVRAAERRLSGFAVSTVEILDSRGEQALGKPRGRYITVELDGYIRREENAFADACAVLSGELRSLCGLEKAGNVLVVGLGNRDITPDAIGPCAVDSVMVTRHLTERMPTDFAAFRPVAAVCAGVLGTTGVESGEIAAAVAERVHPALIIAIDALASRSTERLCRTVQISDTGIVPGSGVGNARAALNRESMGVPVIAVGVPTVVDAATLAADLALRAGVDLDPDAFGEGGGMIVTPRDIDRSVHDIAKLIGYSLDLALHDGLSLEDIDMFLS